MRANGGKMVLSHQNPGGVSRKRSLPETLATADYNRLSLQKKEFRIECPPERTVLEVLAACLEAGRKEISYIPTL